MIPEKSEQEARIDAILSIPAQRRPSRRRPLPQPADKLIRDYYNWERFDHALADGVSVLDAGKLIGLNKTIAYELRKRIEEAGSPTGLFQRKALELFRSDSFPWGHQIADEGLARPFFTRLVGGSEVARELENQYPSESHRKALIRQRYKSGDIITVQYLLFAANNLLG
jgi:hypothetical protein